MSLEVCSAEDYIDYEIEGAIHSSSFINSLIVPRPIALITSVGSNGVVNAAPFSYFSVACTNPAVLSVAIERRNGVRKDTSRNIIKKKEFVVNVCSIQHAKAVGISGGDFPPSVCEVDLASLTLIPSSMISVPRIANTLAQLECKLYQVVELGNDPTDLILGQIIKAHVHKSIVGTDQRVDPKKLNPLARLSGSTYANLSNYFNIPRGV